ncbi:MAG: hypothetical protein M3Z08_17540 [Chloroflexota bacterium]|nr:hypothetical protein [Chloroflexota bacterium]
MYDLRFAPDESLKIRECIRECGPIDKETIIQKTGCSPDIIDTVVDFMLRYQMIAQSGVTLDGRSQPLYTFIVRQYSTYRFNLPEDLGLVKIRAYADALEFAFNNIRFESPRSDPIQSARFFAEEWWMYAVSMSADSRITEIVVVEEVGSTNNPDLFREVYIDAFVTYYPDVLERLRSRQIVIDSTLLEEDRPLLFYHLAEQAIASGS